MATRSLELLWIKASTTPRKETSTSWVTRVFRWDHPPVYALSYNINQQLPLFDFLLFRVRVAPATTRCSGTTAASRRTSWRCFRTTSATSTPGSVDSWCLGSTVFTDIQFWSKLLFRCTRAVSYPTPTYYAHLVADRARKHHNELSSLKEGSVSGSGGYDLPENQKLEIKKLVEEGVKNSMYFVWC